MKTLLLGAAVLLLGCAPAVDEPEAADREPASQGQLPQPPGVFPDFGFMVPDTTYRRAYAGEPLFRLKTDFPTELPPASEIPSFITDIDFRTEPREYILAVRDYAFEGNLPAFGGGAKPWDPFGNPVRDWYHIPWLHVGWSEGYPPNGGTEGFHGLIKEAGVAPRQLAATQNGSYQVYANTLVNAFAGYTLGRMWANPDDPDPGATDRRFGGGFPVGTVFAKLLFVDAPEGDDVIPFLDNPVEWNAYVTRSWNSPDRVVKKVRLLQMDVMVRDPRAEEYMGWVFGTFVYNGAVADPVSNFLNLVPLGVQWGNDPDDTTNRVNPYPPKPIETIVNPDLEQQAIFTESVPPQHLGWNSRLNGPADLNTSSCMSCHATAQYPAVTSLVAPGMAPPGGPSPPPQGGSAEWMQWFQNYKWATPMNPRTYSADFSLQVVISLDNFFRTRNEELKGLWAVEYEFPPNAVARDGAGGQPRRTP